MSPWLRTTLPERRLQGVRHSAPHPLRPVGAAAPPPRPRATPQAALDTPATATLCTGGADGAALAPGAGTAPDRVRHACSGPTGARGLRLAEQHRLHCTPDPQYPPACRRGRAACDGALHRRGRRTLAVGVGSHGRQLLFASRQLTRAVATAPAAPWDGLRQAMAASDAGAGGGIDGPCLDAPRGAALPGAAVATTRGGVRKRVEERARRVAVS